MNILDILLGGQALALVAICASLFITFRALIMWTRNRTILENQLAEIKTQMTMITAELPKKKERIREREQQLPPLKRQFQKMRDYERILNDLALEAEEEEAANKDGKKNIKTKGSIESGSRAKSNDD